MNACLNKGAEILEPWPTALCKEGSNSPESGERQGGSREPLATACLPQPPKEEAYKAVGFQALGGRRLDAQKWQVKVRVCSCW